MSTTNLKVIRLTEQDLQLLKAVLDAAFDEHTSDKSETGKLFAMLIEDIQKRIAKQTKGKA